MDAFSRSVGGMAPHEKEFTMKKRWIALVLACGMLLCANVGLARDSNLVWAIIDGKTADRVHLREQASARSKSLGLYFTGTAVQCEPSYGQEWTWVNVGAEAGYIKSEYLYQGSDWSRIVSLQPSGMVNSARPGSWVNMRSYPDINGQIVARLRHGDWVTILGETKSEWYYVQVGDLYGYISADYLRVSDSSGAYGSAPGQAVAGAPNPGLSAPSPSKPGADQGYTLLTYTTPPNAKSNVSVQYPRFTGAGMDALNGAVYQKVQSLVNEPAWDYGAEVGLTCDYQCAVTLLNNKMVSMVFWGSSDLEGSAHPNSDLYAFTLDLTTSREVALSDLYSVDASLGAIFFQRATFPSAPVTSFSADRFSEMLREEAEYYADAFLYPGSVVCFLKPDGIVLSLGATHASGCDHFEGQLRYSDIQGYARLGANDWQ